MDPKGAEMSRFVPFAGWSWAQDVGATQIWRPDSTPLGPESGWSSSLLVQIYIAPDPQKLGLALYTPKVGHINQAWAQEAPNAHGLRSRWLALGPRGWCHENLEA